MEAKLDVFIPVRSLKSMEGGKPYNNKMDDIMYEKLKEAEHKRITYKLTELTVKEAAKSASDPILLESAGDLTVAGVTKKVTMPVQMKIEGNILRFSAKTTAKMSDFQVEPPAPAIMGGLIKTGDEIKLSIDWVTAAPKKP